MQKKYSVNTDRKLHIYTYGTTIFPEMPHQIKSTCAIYNASILRGQFKKGSADFKALTKLRGTSLLLQYEMRNAVLFEQFVDDIIKNIESNDLHEIAIICKMGRHRSVACAEMLIFLYPNRTVTHLTI